MLLAPRLLPYAVAIWLLVVGAMGLLTFYTHRTSVLGFSRDESADFSCLPRTSLLEPRPCPVYQGTAVRLEPLAALVASTLVLVKPAILSYVVGGLPDPVLVARGGRATPVSGARRAGPD